jgi:hypothetical protein
VTLLLDNAFAGQPGTHLLAIGVGSYRHLLGGGGPLADRPLGLTQLDSPPVSLQAVLNWFLAPAIMPGSVGFVNSSTPLSSVEALVSSAGPFSVDTPTGPATLDAANLAQIQDSFEAWLGRLKSHPDNIGVFYYCGHGFMVSDHYLLAEDFGHSSTRPWAHAFDISTTMRAVEREVAGSVFYFIDACRKIAREVAETLGANPNALMVIDFKKNLIRKSSTAIFATGEGDLAFAPQGAQVSHFTAALLCAISGFCGIKAAGTTTWNVDGESIAIAIRQLLEFNATCTPGRTPVPRQVSEQSIHGISVPFLKLALAPKVKVSIDLSPQRRRALYELYIQALDGKRWAQTLLDKIFRIEVTRGFYEVGAHDPAGVLPAVIHEEEELVPPIYTLRIESPP